MFGSGEDTEEPGVPVNERPGRIGPYRPLQRIGVGGMGEVFLALDGDGRAVAVKALHPALAADPQSRTRLRREVETMRRVRSSRVAEVVDFDLGDSPYIVTRYVQGRSLADVVADRGPLHDDDLVRLAHGLAEALSAIHVAGCVHRDLKPTNVMLDDGEPVIIDFGIAHAVDATRVTQHGAAGSPGYVAPEVLEGGRVEPAADIFAWGGTVAFAATGRHAFGAATPQAVYQRTLAGRPRLDGVAEPLRPLVADALAADPAGRPDASALLRRLTAPRDDAAPEAPESPGPPSPESRSSRWQTAEAPTADPAPRATAGGRMRRPGDNEGRVPTSVMALIAVGSMVVWAPGWVWLLWAIAGVLLGTAVFYADRDAGEAQVSSALSGLLLGGLIASMGTYAVALFVRLAVHAVPLLGWLGGLARRG